MASMALAHVPVVFVFSGQSAQRPGMGLQLATAEPAFARALDDCAALLNGHGIDLFRLLSGADGSLDSTAGAQPAIFSLEWGLASMWIARGVEPAMMLGHSLGEIVAAAVAEVMSLSEAIRMVVARGRAMAKAAPGTMTVVTASEQQLHGHLGKDCVIASINSEVSCTVSGSVPAIAAFEARMGECGYSHRRLNVSNAFHSALMRPILPELAATFKTISLRKPARTVVSCVTGAILTEREATNPDFWVEHTVLPVRFLDAMRRIASDIAPVWLEIGPTRMLAGLIEAVFGPGTRAFASLQRDGDEREAIKTAMRGLTESHVLLPEQV
jgi:phthiocerol/phenolphthiocerol synthesis type-I polyketide synthase E